VPSIHGRLHGGATNWLKPGPGPFEKPYGGPFLRLVDGAALDHNTAFGAILHGLIDTEHPEDSRGKAQRRRQAMPEIYEETLDGH